MSPQLKYYYKNKEKCFQRSKDYKKRFPNKIREINWKSYHKCKKLKRKEFYEEEML